MAFETFLKKNGFKPKSVECVCPHCVDAAEFALTHPHGRYVLICQDRSILLTEGILIGLRGNADDIVLYYYEGGDE